MNQMASPLEYQLATAYKARQARYNAIASQITYASALKERAAREDKEAAEKERLHRMRAHQAGWWLLRGFALALRDGEVIRNFRVRDIQSKVAKHFGLELNDILAERRMVKIVLPRQIAMYLAKELTLKSLMEIGRMFNRDHTTVLSNIRKISEMIASDPVFRAKVEALREEIAPTRGSAP